MKAQRMIFGALAASSLFWVQAASAVVVGYYPHGWYATAGFGTGPTQISDMSGQYNGADATLKTKKKTHSELGMQIGGGYALNGFPMRFDLSYLKQGEMEYDENPVFEGQNAALRTKLNSEALFLNTTVDVKIWRKIFPYLKVGVGYARNKAKSTITDTSTYSYTKTKMNLAYQIGLGLDYRAMPNLVFDFGFLYGEYGKVNLAAWPETAVTSKVQAKTFSSERFVIGLTYYFDDQTEQQEPKLLNEYDEYSN